MLSLSGAIVRSLAAGLVALCLLAAPAQAATYLPVGPQQNVPVATVTGGGWFECFRETYDQATTPIATALAPCAGGNLMMACRPTGSATLQLLAQAPKPDVLFDVGTGEFAVHTANGSDWYFNGSWSWGFLKAGDPVDRDFCDEAAGGVAADRLCWHTFNNKLGNSIGTGGYRCGANIFLNSSAAFERILYTDALAPAPVPTLPSWMLMAFAALLLSVALIMARGRGLQLSRSTSFRR